MATKIWERMQKALHSAVELKVVTFIGDAEIKAGQAGQKDAICKPDITLPKGSAKAIVTCINLVEGDITNCLSEKFIVEDMGWIRDYHTNQVNFGKEIVNSNMRLIGEMGTRLAQAIMELKNTEESK